MAKKKPDTQELQEAPKAKPKRAIDFQYIPIDLIIANIWNPNEQDELTFNLLQDEIAEVGLIDPIEVVPMDDGTYLILGGEHRWRAAKALGYEEVPCVLLTDAKWQNGDLQRFVTVRLNVIHGKLNPEKFMSLYQDLSKKYGDESMQRLLGYADSKQFQKMLGWVKRGLKEGLPKDMADQVDSAIKDVKNVADLGNIIQEMFQKYGETLSQSFMVFSYGKESHVYISLDAKGRRAIGRVMECCKLLNQDINSFFVPVLDEATKKASIEIEKKKQEEAVTGSSSIAPPKTEW